MVQWFIVAVIFTTNPQGKLVGEEVRLGPFLSERACLTRLHTYVYDHTQLVGACRPEQVVAKKG